ncbi:MAG: oligosaccharide flippase family protein [Bacteroidales bacterium]|nr:oligosaccharide flippase family protein [Bacteroidales bacterium]
MGVIARQSVKGALANYLGVLVGFFTTFFVLTDCLTRDEIGFTRVLVDAAMLFSSLAQLGSNASIVRFFPYFKDDDRNHGIFGWSVLVPFVGFCLLSVVVLLFKDSIVRVYSASGQTTLVADYFYLLLPLTFFALYMTVFETNASVLMRITVPKMVREVGIRVFNLVCYLLYGYGVIGFQLFVVLFCLSYALAMLLNLFYLLHLGRISFRIDFHFLDRRLLRDMLRYTLFMTATVLAGNIPLLNTLFLGAKSGLELTGVYTIASYIANIVEVPYRSLGAISAPMISHSVKEENWREVNRLAQQVSLYQFLVASLIFFFIWTNLQTLFAVIPNGEKYVGGVGVVFFLGLAKLVNSSLSISTNILNYSRHYARSLPFILLLTLSAIAFNHWLIPLWGISGSACASLFSYLLYYACLLGFLAWRQRVSLFSVAQLKVLLMAVTLFVLSWLWDRLLSPTIVGDGTMARYLLDSLLRTLVFAVVAVVAVCRLRVAPPVNDLLQRLLRRFWPRRS